MDGVGQTEIGGGRVGDGWRIGGEGLRVNTSERIETPSPLFVCIWHGHFSHIVAVPWVL